MSFDEFMEHAFDWVMKPLMTLIVVLLGAAMFIGIPYGVYAWVTYKPPETFSLRVDSWRCTKQHEQDREICTKGCRWVRDVICDQWTAH